MNNTSGGSLFSPIRTSHGESFPALGMLDDNEISSTPTKHSLGASGGWVASGAQHQGSGARSSSPICGERTRPPLPPPPSRRKPPPDPPSWISQSAPPLPPAPMETMLRYDRPRDL